MSDARNAPYCDTVVLKVASRCNLNCSYCYVYNQGNESWRRQPSVISHECIAAVAARIAEHCRRHALPSFAVILHGGEPLMIGARRLEQVLRVLRDTIAEHTTVHLSVQTNGVLVDDRLCVLLKRYDVSVGVSVDGTPANHDADRVDHFGRGSYDATIAGWRLLQAHGLNPSLLCVVDTAMPPGAVYDHIRGLAPRKADFLLPDINYATAAPGALAAGEDTGDWLIALFDRWAADGMPFRISLFAYIINRVLGGAHRTDALGADPNHVLVIETNGAIEPVDVLKICGDGFTLTRHDVHAGPLDDAFADDGIRLYYNSGSSLCATCARCHIRDICGGGYLPHRFSAANGFDNPSIHCLALSKLICHVQNHVLGRLPPALLTKYDLEHASHRQTIDLLAEAGLCPAPLAA